MDSLQDEQAESAREWILRWTSGSLICLSLKATRDRSFRGGGCHQRVIHRRWDPVRSLILIADSRQLLPRFLSLTLPVPHTGIKAAACQKLPMGSSLGDAALIEYDDFVGADDRR